MRSHLLLAGALLTGALALAGGAGASRHAAAALPDFGPNVKIFDPSMSTAQIKAVTDQIASQQVSDQFGTNRYALLFMPGAYGTATPLSFDVGYYTQVAGLGASPNDVTINGTVDSYNQCVADPNPNNPPSCTALVNFWRSIENLTINVNTAAKKDCKAAAEFWATSQAAPLRRVHVNGFTTLFDFCSGPGFSSGGFIADSQFTGSTIVNGTQQQYLVRNSDIDGWTNGVWNQVFAGVKNAPPQSFPGPPNPYTTLDTSPATREKPFLYVDANRHFNVLVPDAQYNTSGTTWSNGQTPGRAIPIENFFIAKPSDSAKTIDKALSRGMNLIFTPGVYEIDHTLRVKRADTVVLGLGMATLTAENGVTPMVVDDDKGVDISGLIFDAGPKTSRTLLQFGKGDDDAESGEDLGRSDGNGNKPNAADPGALQDVFFRIGGAHAGSATTSLVVAQDDAILDDIWAWRADHGAGVGWTLNTADTGVRVTGDNVTANGLFVEHFQKYEVFWAGENGRTIMFQNEMPYDPPDQAAFQHDGILGWAAYKVADNVQTHEGWGLGSYCFFNVNPAIHAAHAFEVPVRPGIELHDILSLSITAAGVIDHVVDDTGAPTPPNTTPVDIVSFP
jgi:hypothetical protein